MHHTCQTISLNSETLAEQTAVQSPSWSTLPGKAGTHYAKSSYKETSQDKSPASETKVHTRVRGQQPGQAAFSRQCRHFTDLWHRGTERLCHCAGWQTAGNRIRVRSGVSAQRTKGIIFGHRVATRTGDRHYPLPGVNIDRAIWKSGLLPIWTTGETISRPRNDSDAADRP